jgi:iron complex transport system substrate-binding protein
VSLLPSATEIVCALGLEDRVVGISHGCDYPPSITNRPRLTRPRFDGSGLSSGEIDAAVRAALRDHASVYEIDVAAIEALQPDLVLTQGICDVCAVPEQQATAALSELSPAPRILALDAHDLAAIFESILAVGRATGAVAAADTLVGGLRRRLDGVRERGANRRRPRVLALEWLDPPYVPGHWVPELIEIAGGELLAGIARQPSYRVEWPMLRALEPSPDVLLVMPCGLSLEETRREVQRYEAKLHGLAPTVRCLDAAAYFSRSGPRVIDGLEILASAIFPS